MLLCEGALRLTAVTPLSNSFLPQRLALRIYHRDLLIEE
jgi:hypothetical protein